MKFLKYVVILLFIPCFTIFILVLLDGFNEYPKQIPPSKLLLRQPVPQFYPPIDSTEYYTLLERFGKNKELPRGYEIQALTALSFYPQLKEIPIKFKIVETYLPLASRPKISTVLFPWESREYEIIISSKSDEKLESVLLKNLPYNAQVGVLGHELAHTVFYLDKFSYEHVGIAINYFLFDDYHQEFERDTDKRAISFGLGYPLKDWSAHIRKAMRESGIEEEERQTVERIYLSPEQITEEMSKHEFYH